MQVAVNPPHSTVIVVVPGLIARTVPLLTLANEGFELDHFSVLSVAFSGDTLTVSVLLSPVSIKRLDGDNSTFVTGT